ncbi:MAG: alpha-N-acetylglucosaminidase N-terminal domain-containing protein, partial [Muribaculaceae bacterium]|nr:alpha-N-acetylglucosaminidase N-terminal domain-containing protein [Muribaculaceae bacterium]
MKSLSRTLAAALLGSISLAGFGADSNPRAVSDLLDRIGGTGTASRFVTVVDETLAPDGSEKFVITSAEGKPCVKGSTLSALTAGLGWYLNHYANINLTWNRPTADFSSLPLP